MTGEELYNKYRFAIADEGVEIKRWDRLSEFEQNAWTSVADEITDTIIVTKIGDA